MTPYQFCFHIFLLLNHTYSANVNSSALPQKKKKKKSLILKSYHVFLRLRKNNFQRVTSTFVFSFPRVRRRSLGCRKILSNSRIFVLIKKQDLHRQTKLLVAMASWCQDASCTTEKEVCCYEGLCQDFLRKAGLPEQLWATQPR